MRGLICEGFGFSGVETEREGTDSDETGSNENEMECFVLLFVGKLGKFNGL